MPPRHVRTSPVPALAAVVAATLVVTLLTAARPAAAAPFTDMTDGSYNLAVVAMVEEGLMRGCGDGEFCPDDAMTRGQVATVLVGAMGLAPSTQRWFLDARGSVHEANINALAAAGITQGCDLYNFCPDQPMTRAQLASMLASALLLDPAHDVEDEFSLATTGAYFDDAEGIHGAAVNQLAAVGIVAGCASPLTAFCPDEPVLRLHAAAFVARALDLVPRVELSPLEERRALQAEIDEAAAKARAEEQARREAEAEAEAQSSRNQIWDRLAECESNQNWSINTGNGYYGGLQFSLSSWRWVGGTGYPHHHSREVQIQFAERLLERQGWGAWPACSRKIGLR